MRLSKKKLLFVFGGCLELLILCTTVILEYYGLNNFMTQHHITIAHVMFTSGILFILIYELMNYLIIRRLTNYKAPLLKIDYSVLSLSHILFGLAATYIAVLSIGSTLAINMVMFTCIILTALVMKRSRKLEDGIYDEYLVYKSRFIHLKHLEGYDITCQGYQLKFTKSILIFKVTNKLELQLLGLDGEEKFIRHMRNHFEIDG